MKSIITLLVVSNLRIIPLCAKDHIAEPRRLLVYITDEPLPSNKLVKALD